MRFSFSSGPEVNGDIQGKTVELPERCHISRPSWLTAAQRADTAYCSNLLESWRRGTATTLPPSASAIVSESVSSPSVAELGWEIYQNALLPYSLLLMIPLTIRIRRTRGPTRPPAAAPSRPRRRGGGRRRRFRWRWRSRCSRSRVSR